MSKLTKDSKYICKTCGKNVQKWNKTHHENTKYHRLLIFCKNKINDIIDQSQLKSNAGLYERNNNKT